MDSWTVGKVLTWATTDFKQRGVDRPRFEAEVLLAEVLGIARLDLYTGFERPLEEGELRRYREAIIRRRAFEPAAYITGRREFWSRDFIVDSRVLVPRPETETLVQEALHRLPETGRVLDLCTGSGCVAVTLALERPQMTVDAVDISKDACEVAAANAARHGVTDRVNVIDGDLFDPLPEGARYDIITSNPPYVADADMDALQEEVRHEPRLALAGGPDGLDVIRRIVEQAPTYLVPRGWLLLEADPRQMSHLVSDLGPRFFPIEGMVIADLSGRERVAAWQKGAP
jgi:release factor glutamine methyltransferase